jgi:hypothetical protein
MEIYKEKAPKREQYAFHKLEKGEVLELSYREMGADENEDLHQSLFARALRQHQHQTQKGPKKDWKQFRVKRLFVNDWKLGFVPGLKIWRIK